MSEPSHPELKTGKLWVMTALAAVYCGWTFTSQGTPTRVDGVAGVLLGLYICSHPAANALDRLFLNRYAGWRQLFQRAGILWLALNGLVLALGWFVITLGATRLAGRPS
jgi:hypothetical protein